MHRDARTQATGAAGQGPGSCRTDPVAVEFQQRDQVQCKDEVVEDDEAIQRWCRPAVGGSPERDRGESTSDELEVRTRKGLQHALPPLHHQNVGRLDEKCRRAESDANPRGLDAAPVMHEMERVPEFVDEDQRQIQSEQDRDTETRRLGAKSKSWLRATVTNATTPPTATSAAASAPSRVKTRVRCGRDAGSTVSAPVHWIDNVRRKPPGREQQQPDPRPEAGDPGDAPWSEVMADDAPSPLPPASRGRPGLHPVHLGLDRPAQGRHALACQCLHVPGLVPRHPRPVATTTASRSHAPFHFDLSIFDLFVSCRNAATLVLIGESLGKEPARLGDFLADRRISVWYSAPSILALLTRARRPGPARLPAPRLVLFAGEVFPIAPLAQAAAALARGPALEPLRADRDQRLHGLPDPATDPGRPDRRPTRSARSARRSGPGSSTRRAGPCPPGTLGELVIAGPGVMRGYFGQPELTARAFFVATTMAPLVSHRRPRRRRRDRLLPVPRPPRSHGQEAGYRIELGEIESASIATTASTARRSSPGPTRRGSSIAAFVALKPDQKKSIIAMKRHCTIYLPHYMVPDTITFVNSLPATSTDKVDYQKLKPMAAGGGPRLVNRPVRGVFRWKFPFYELLLPVLRLLGPARCSTPSSAPGAAPRRRSGRGGRPGWSRPSRAPRRRSELDGAGRGRSGRSWRPTRPPPGPRLPARPAVRRAVARPLRGPRARSRCDRALAAGTGAILVGSHMGAHIAGLHWLFRNGLPIRAMVQRPAMSRRARTGCSTRREVPTPRPTCSSTASSRRRSASSGWSGPGRPSGRHGDLPLRRHPLAGPQRPTGRLLGQSQRFLAIWTELAVLTRAPVFHVFCTHLPGGRFPLELEGIGRIHRRRGGRRAGRLPQAARGPDRHRPDPGRRPSALALLRPRRRDAGDYCRIFGRGRATQSAQSRPGAMITAAADRPARATGRIPIPGRPTASTEAPLSRRLSPSLWRIALACARGIEPDEQRRPVEPGGEPADLFPGRRGDVEMAGTIGRFDRGAGREAGQPKASSPRRPPVPPRPAPPGRRTTDASRR